MDESVKVLQMIFATAEGGTFRISVGNTRDDLEDKDVKDVMDTIAKSKAFKTGKGEVTNKVEARYVTQQIQKVEIAD